MSDNKRFRSVLAAGAVAMSVLLGASAAQAAAVTWYLIDWEFETGDTASGSFAYDAQFGTWFDINVTSEIGPTTFNFRGNAASSDQLAFLTAPANSGNLDGTFALDGKLATPMTNSGGTVTIPLVLGNNFFSSQLTCGDANCNSAGNPIYLVSGSISTVPVPGAVWLFVSGLMAIGTVARRRKQTA